MIDSWLRSLSLSAPLSSSSSSRWRTGGGAQAQAGQPLLLGHRGAKARAPENTLGAFQAAFDDGGHGIELDVQLSRDGIPIVLHDDTLDRTSSLRGQPWRFDADELTRADASSWFQPRWSHPEHVPTLDEVLRAMPNDAVVNVELKGPSTAALGLEQRVLDVIERHHTRVHIIVSSFHPAQLLQVRRLWSSLPIGLLLDDAAILPLRVGMASRALQPDAIHPPASLVNERLVRRCRDTSTAIHVWGIPNEVALDRILGLGVDAVIVDDVAATAAAIRTRL